MNDRELLKRITVNPEIFGGKPLHVSSQNEAPSEGEQKC